MEKFLDNLITINAPKNTVTEILLNPQQLKLWNVAIDGIQPSKDKNQFTILRREEALNHLEQFTLSQKDDLLTYHVYGDKISYEVQFVLTDENKQTVVAEQVYLDLQRFPTVPTRLLRPVVKHAFMQNLRMLATLAENQLV